MPRFLLGLDMPKSPEPKVITKKHLARVERERIQRRILLFGMGIVVIAVVGLIVFGILDQTVLFQYKPVATVNGTKISVGEFQRQYQYERMLALQTGLETNVETGQRVVNKLVENVLISAKAKELGIEVTDADGLPHTGMSGLGKPGNSACMRVPRPPAKIKTRTMRPLR
ncbi:MAG: hypothetical protein HGA86_00930, partial [Anaerolineaceae bacterium]|nr:hypothetical protein [Anaerolineaceae bacterium]